MLHFVTFLCRSKSEKINFHLSEASDEFKEDSFKIHEKKNTIRPPEELSFLIQTISFYLQSPVDNVDTSYSNVNVAILRQLADHTFKLLPAKSCKSPLYVAAKELS